MNKLFRNSSKTVICIIVSFLMIFAVVIAVNVNDSIIASAETSGQNTFANAIGNNSSAPFGLYTHLTLNINGGSGKVWATVKNDVSLFPSKVMVIVELYSSDTYHESYLDMTLAATNSIDDLNMGKSIVAECSTGGVQKYWQARMKYKIDNAGWKSETTRTMLCSADGTYLE